MDDPTFMPFTYMGSGAVKALMSAGAMAGTSGKPVVKTEDDKRAERLNEYSALIDHIADVAEMLANMSRKTHKAGALSFSGDALTVYAWPATTTKGTFDPETGALTDGEEVPTVPPAAVQEMAHALHAAEVGLFEDLTTAISAYMAQLKEIADDHRAACMG